VILDDAPGRVLKPGVMLPDDARLSLSAGPRWASRGGLKLAAALDAFAISPRGLACLDAGSSTGGFTDVLLDRGARTVYAVDVGHGQLLHRLRTDPRVVVMERTNLRTLERLPEPIDLATLDLSFISLRLVLPAVARLLAATGHAVALVKPQFEAGREAVPRGGVVRDPAVHRDVLRAVGEAARSAGLPPVAVIRSPIEGGEGNAEFLALLTVASHGDADEEAWESSVRVLLEGPA
jgi:23S rRNA (cytidine1920-2'-O)/16S rRNA (cytidine1409-2'-O)-methyltransferase